MDLLERRQRNTKMGKKKKKRSISEIRVVGI